MTRDPHRRILIPKLLDAELTPEEEKLLQASLENPIHQQLLHELSREGALKEEVDLFEQVSRDIDARRNELLSKLLTVHKMPREPKVISLFKRSPVLSSAALLFIIVAAGVIIWKLTHADRPQEPVTRYEGRAVEAPQNIFNASLILPNGDTIQLQNEANGKLAGAGDIPFRKISDSVLLFTPVVANGYATLETPPGSKFGIVMPDSSRIWLNAASYIRFPLSFVTAVRKINLSGEADFEVASHTGTKGQALPFIVEAVSGKRAYEIEVLGTHFTVKAYADEPAIIATVLKGKIKLQGAGATRTLLAGEQGSITNTGLVAIQDSMAIDQAIAWRNGYFSFERADIKTIVEELARWYNLQPKYEKEMGNEKNYFHGAIPRDKPLKNVLEILEFATDIRFEIKGDTMIVKP